VASINGKISEKCINLRNNKLDYMHEPAQLIVKGYKIDPIIFSRGYPKGCGPYMCNSVCCSDGVWVDIKEKERILEEKDLIIRYMDDTQDTNPDAWFAEYEKDDDFPSGVCVGTTTRERGCVFLNKDGLCTLQVAAVGEGMHKWDIKPFYCVLFPISIADNTITFDEHKQGESQCCTVHPAHLIPLFEACKAELVYAVGEDGYTEIEEYYNTHRDYFQNAEVTRNAI
jgi:hypothetical protein